MELDFLRQYLVPEVFILIPVLYLIGLILRQTPNIPNWTDAWVKLVIAIVSCGFIIGWSIDAFIQGILVSGAASLMKDLLDRTITGVQVQNLQNKSIEPTDNDRYTDDI